MRLPETQCRSMALDFIFARDGKWIIRRKRNG